MSGVTNLFELRAVRIDGRDEPLSTYAGKVVLVVNTASRCGFTPQYAGLQELYDEYADRGLVILGFPCDQFGHQEPGTEAEITEFCQVNYGVTFPMFAKVDVNGKGTHPVFRFLKSSKGGLLGDKIKWNFTKFLVDREGNVVERYATTTKPAKLAADIEKLL
jgi:glutathione peroxidase